jgi:hypothetical protein
LALQLSDLSGDYIIRDRSAVPYESVLPALRDLGWAAGYSAAFTRLNRSGGEYTTVSQRIGIYPLDSINSAYITEKEEMLSCGNPTRRYEIPAPVVGGRSIAWRASPQDELWGIATYTVIFTRKNAIEKISMIGTATDYEELRDIVLVAAGKIR